MLNDFDQYTDLPLHFLKEEYDVGLMRNYPVVGLDDIVLHFIHYIDFNSAVAIWNQRKSRINKDNLFIEMALDNYKDIEKFVTLPFQHKIGLSTIPCEERDVLYCRTPNDFEDKYVGRHICGFLIMLR